VVVPAVGIVIGDEDGHRFPLRQLLQGVYGLNQKLLFEQRGGVGRVASVRLAGFDETNGREVSAVGRVPEIGEGVIVVGLIG